MQVWIGAVMGEGRQERFSRYLEMAGLAFSAFDFVVRPDGTWIALEANAIAAWGRLAEACGLPIAAAIADALIKE